MNPNVDLNTFNTILNTVNQMLNSNPLLGILTIALSFGIFYALIILLVKSAIKIIKANKSTASYVLNQEKFTNTILKITEEIITLNHEQREVTTRIVTMKNTNELRDQITLVENNLAYLKSIATHEMSHLIQDHISYTQPVKNLSLFRDFELALNFTAENVKVAFRRMLKEYKLSEFSDAVYRDFVKEKVVSLKLRALNDFELFYSSSIVPFSVVRASFEENFKKYEEVVEKTLYGCKEIGLGYEERIKNEEEAFQQKWGKFISTLGERLQGCMEKA